MTLTVSISELRSNLAQYLDRVANGANLVIRDEKKNLEIAQVTKISSFDPDAYEQAMRRAAGVFTAKNHPEWATKSKISKWLRKSRLSDDRSF